MSSLRTQCLEYIAKSGGEMLAVQDIADGLQVEPQKVRQALKDASKEGYVKFGRDEVTATGGYSLTVKGAARVKAGHQSVNGKTAEENKAASDARETGAAFDAGPLGGGDIYADDDEPMPPADPALLAMANRAISEQMESLKQEKAELEAELKAVRLEAKMLSNTLAACGEDKAKMRALIDSQRDQIADFEVMPKSLTVNKWAHAWKDGIVMFDTEAEARADIEKAIGECPISTESYLCAVVEVASNQIVWSKP